MQKNINLSIQCPNDDSSLLPIHSDTWDGNSPFEAVLWVPFVDCYKTKSMFILNAKKYVKFEKAYKKKEIKSANDLYSNLRPHIEFVKIKYGEFMLFNQNLPHGNVVNKSNETRISLNCRFKSLFTPYRQKELGTFLPYKNFVGKRHVLAFAPRASDRHRRCRRILWHGNVVRGPERQGTGISIIDYFH